MSVHPVLKGLFYLFNCLLEVFSNFQQFPGVAEIIKNQLARSIVMIGHRWHGLISIASSQDLTFPVAEVGVCLWHILIYSSLH